MTERLDKLRHALDELEEELAKLDNEKLGAVDEETRAALEDARSEIQSVLEASRPDEPASGGLIDQLRVAEQQFESDHPTISGILVRMVDLLGQMGI